MPKGSQREPKGTKTRTEPTLHGRRIRRPSAIGVDPLAFFWVPLASFWFPFASFWVHFGTLLASFWLRQPLEPIRLFGSYTYVGAQFWAEWTFGLDLEHVTNPPRGVVKEGSGTRREPVSRTRE